MFKKSISLNFVAYIWIITFKLTTKARLMMTTKHTKLDFTGQHIFIALDIAKKSWKTSIMTQEFEHKTFTQPPTVEALVHYLHHHFPGAQYHCVYEAGYCGFWIHDQLKHHRIDCIVVNPADVPTTHREHTFKTDRVDARKLVRNLRNGELDPIYVPSRAAQEDRTLVRLRFAMVKKQTRCKNQLKALLGYYGIIIPEELCDAHWSRRFIAYLEQLTMQRAAGNQALKALLDELHHLRQTVAQLTKSIRALASAQPYQTLVAYLVTIPGISTLAAMVLLTELIDIHRFATLDHLASYVGLVPGEHSSGENVIVTGITKRRNPFLRAILIESAWVAVRKDPALIMAFQQLAHRMPKNQAIVRIARKLLNRIRYVLKHQQPYQIRLVA
jgi:transposase